MKKRDGCFGSDSELNSQNACRSLFCASTTSRKPTNTTTCRATTTTATASTATELKINQSDQQFSFKNLILNIKIAKARRHDRANPVAVAHKHLVCQTGLLFGSLF